MGQWVNVMLSSGTAQIGLQTGPMKTITDPISRAVLTRWARELVQPAAHGFHEAQDSFNAAQHNFIKLLKTL